MSDARDIRERVTLTFSQQQRLRKFWMTAMPLRVLADEWGCSEPHLSQQAKRMGLPARNSSERMVEIRAASKQIPKHFSTPYLTAEAIKRGISPDRLVLHLLNTISRDRLVDAILDDGQKAA